MSTFHESICFKMLLRVWQIHSYSTASLLMHDARQPQPHCLQSHGPRHLTCNGHYLRSETPHFRVGLRTQDKQSYPQTLLDFAADNGAGSRALPEQPAAEPRTYAPSSKLEGDVHAEGLEGSCPVVEYQGAPLPANEEERYQAVCGLEALDETMKPDERFDDITKLVATHPSLQSHAWLLIALRTMSTIQKKRVCHKLECTSYLGLIEWDIVNK